MKQFWFLARAAAGWLFVVAGLWLMPVNFRDDFIIKLSKVITAKKTPYRILCNVPNVKKIKNHTPKNFSGLST